MSTQDVIVLGGGISGLSYAWGAAARGHQVLVLDAASRPGGCLHSARTDDGYWFELGAHTCYNSYGGLLAILADLGLMDRLRPRQKAPFRLLVDGELRPVGKALGKLRLLAGLTTLPFTKKEGRTVRQYFSRLAGRKNYDDVLSPLLAAVPSQPADDFPATMLFKKRPRDKRVLRSFTLDGGLATVTDALAASPGVTTRTDAEVSAVHREGAAYTVTLASGERLAAAHVAVALPPDAAARVLGAGFPDLAAELGALRVTAVDTLGFAFAKDRLALPPVAGIVPQRRDLFFSAVTRDVLDDPAHRGVAFHFAAGHTPAARRARALEVLGAADADVAAAFTRTSHLPSPAPDHPAQVARIVAALPATGLALTGSYFAGLAIEDCIGRSFAELDRLLGPVAPRG